MTEQRGVAIVPESDEAELNPIPYVLALVAVVVGVPLLATLTPLGGLVADWWSAVFEFLAP
jgi:hypothetical protein